LAYYNCNGYNKDNEECKMNKFIKLTEAKNNPALVSTTIILNANNIHCITMSDRGKDVHVRMNDKTFYFVTESIADIWRMLDD
jgi:hypothetical protein